MLSALLRAGRSFTAGLSYLSTADSILMSYQKLATQCARCCQRVGSLQQRGERLHWGRWMVSRVRGHTPSPSTHVCDALHGSSTLQRPSLFCNLNKNSCPPAYCCARVSLSRLLTAILLPPAKK